MVERLIITIANLVVSLSVKKNKNRLALWEVMGYIKYSVLVFELQCKQKSVVVITTK